MLVFNSLEELKPYYHSESNTYVFNDDVTFEFNLDVESDIEALDIDALDINARDINAMNIDAININAMNIDAKNIKAHDINAHNINAHNIYANNINARDINAKDISYDAVCFAYKDITCTSIQGLRHNHKHFVLDGKITIKPKEQPKKKITLEVNDEQLAKIKDIIDENKR